MRQKKKTGKVDETISKEQAAVYQRQVEQEKRALALAERQRDVRAALLKIKRENSELVDGKPKFMTMQEYIDLTIKQEEVVYETETVNVNNEIAKLGASIVGKTNILKKNGYEVA